VFVLLDFKTTQFNVLLTGRGEWKAHRRLNINKLLLLRYIYFKV